MLRGARSDSTVRSQVWRGRPARRFQSLSKGATLALRALDCGPWTDRHVRYDQSTWDEWCGWCLWVVAGQYVGGLLHTPQGFYGDVTEVWILDHLEMLRRCVGSAFDNKPTASGVVSRTDNDTTTRRQACNKSVNSPNKYYKYKYNSYFYCARLQSCLLYTSPSPRD